MRGPNCGRDEQVLQMEAIAQVVGVGSSPEGQVVKRSGQRLKSGRCSFGCRRKKKY